jgi:signal peptidase I
MTAPTQGQPIGYGPMATPGPPAKRGLSTGAIVAIVAGSVALVLVAAAISIGLFVAGNKTVSYTVPGQSMEPTIRSGQVVTAAKVDPGKYQPKRGDIVVFTSPGWVADQSNAKLIKRVIALPGERVVCCDPKGQWMIDGKPLVEAYVKPADGMPPTPMDVTVPEGRLWVMGDNRAASNDSRYEFIMTHDIQVATIPVSSVTAIVKL